MSTPAAAPRDTRWDAFLLVGAMTALMWLIEVVDTIDSHRLDVNGIRPRNGDGLAGIVAAPFLHASWGHLIGNTVPFVAMGLGIAVSGARRLLAVTGIVAFVGGLGTWLIGPANTVHIGASGVVFGYAAYLVARGFFNRRPLDLAMGAVVIAIWGSALLSSLAPRDGISWQGHVFGAVGGLVAAWALARRRDEPVAAAV